MENIHFEKVKEIHGLEGQDFDTQENNEDEQILESETANVKGVASRQEIQSLSKSIQDLAVLFKDLNELVVEQGTILDRIDFNIESA